MKFARTREHRRVASVNMTPLIDLFLNILVFFLVTTTFASDSILYVDLPQAETSETEGVKQQLQIEIATDGDIALDGRRVSLEQLETEFEKIPSPKRASIPVVLRADEGAKHGRVVAVIDLVRAAGLKNLGIATQGPTKQ